MAIYRNELKTCPDCGTTVYIPDRSKVWKFLVNLKYNIRSLFRYKSLLHHAYIDNMWRCPKFDTLNVIMGRR